MDEFTGYHPLVAKQLIKEFKAKGDEIYNKVAAANQKVMNSLADNWFSQNAINFGTEEKPSLYEAQAEVEVLFKNTIYRCVTAYNLVAAAHDADALVDDEYPSEETTVENYAPHGTNDVFNDFKSIGTKDGKVYTGMDTKIVPQLLTEYSEQIKSIILNDMESIPMNIAFYDPDGAQVQAFNAGVEALKATLTAKIDEVSNKLDEHASQEQEMVEVGAEQAAEAMGGGTE